MLLLFYIFIFLFILAFLGKERRNIYGTCIYNEFDKKSMTPLKGILAFLIVLHHLCLYIPIQNSWLAYNISFWGGPIVGCFFFISGFGLMKSLEAKGDLYLNGFLSHRLIKILLPLVIVTLVYQILLLVVGDFSLCNIIKSIFKGDMPLPSSWYVYVIVIFYLIFYYSACFFKKPFLIILSTIVCCFFMTILFLVLGWGTHWSRSLFCLPIGMLVANKENHLKCFMFSSPNFRILCGSVVIVLVGYLVLYYFIGVNEHFISMLNYVACLIASLCMYLFSRMAKAPSNRITNFLGRYSYEIYLVHGALISFFIGVHIDAFDKYLLVYLLTFIVAYVLKKFLYVLGFITL